MVTKKASKKSAKKSTKKKTTKKVRTERKPAAKKTGKKAPGRSAGKADAAKAVDRGDTNKARKKALERSRNYASGNLAAQVVETLLDEIRGLDKVWHKTPEAEQKVTIARLSDAVYTHMQRAVQVLAAQGHKAVICNLFSVTFKDGVRAIVTIPPGSDMRHEMADHATKDVVLVLADANKFMQGLGDLKPDADQPKLI